MYRILMSILLCFLLPHVALAGSHIKKSKFTLPFTITVQPNTFLPDQVATGFTVHAIYQITNNNPITANNATIVSLPPYSSIDPSGCGTTNSFTLAPGQSCTLILIISAAGLTPGTVIKYGTNCAARSRLYQS